MPTHQNHFVYLLSSAEFFEPYRRYLPNLGDFFNVVAATLPHAWEIKRTTDFWFLCKPTQWVTPSQGWKIHLSATPLNASRVLEASLETLFSTGTAFKFALDLQTLVLMNGKNWSRGRSGKFITVYPSSESIFRELLEVLNVRTAGLAGPYILSDRAYKNSRVVFYRYGGFVDTSVASADGQRRHTLVGPDGQQVSDKREPHFVTPEWVKDPVAPPDSRPKSQVKPSNGISLKNGAYTVERALALRNAGGIYVARRNDNGASIILKEARPHIALSIDGIDAVTLLKKEYRLLEKVRSAEIAPAPIDLFTDWEHWFLAEEKIDGENLAQYHSRRCPFLLHSPDERDVSQYISAFRTIFLQVVKHLEVLHSQNIVLVDISATNIMIEPMTLRTRIIDFEAAYEAGVDAPVHMATPGFACSNRWTSGWLPTPEDDLYGLGALMLAMLFRVNAIVPLFPQIAERFLRALVADFGVPLDVVELPLSLLDPEPAKRPQLTEVRERLMPLPRVVSPVRRSRSQLSQIGRFADLAARTIAYIESVADYERQDRLYPSDPRMFQTNPLSLAYGVSGVAYARGRVCGDVREQTIEWILRQPIESHTYPPGLYLGVAGIAWALAEIGLQQKAMSLLSAAHGDPRIYDNPDLLFGAAGWGLANLRFFILTGHEKFLDQALRVAEHLKLSARSDDGAGLCWPVDGVIQLGLGHGASGVALFFLYLYLVTKEDSFLATGTKALDFDLAQAVNRDGGLTWPRYAHARYIVYPYWRYGSAGVGTVVLRYYAVTKGERYLATLEQIAIDTERKYTVFPGLFSGLAGIGHFLLDMNQFTGEERYKVASLRLAEGVELFAIPKPAGVAFPGDGGTRISCDYATGCAGIAVFLDRIAHPEKGSPFSLDELIFRDSARAHAGAPVAIARGAESLGERPA